MTILTRQQIESYARGAGFSGKDLDIAVAVAKAESGWNTQAHNTTGNDDSYGLWQINMKGTLGPDRRKKFGITSDSQLLDPTTNAKAAYRIHKDSGWNAWTTYTSGKYKSFLVDGASSDPSVTPPDASVSTAAGLNGLGATIFKGFANVAGILVAIALLVLGVVLLARNYTPVGQALSAVKGVVKK